MERIYNDTQLRSNKKARLKNSRAFKTCLIFRNWSASYCHPPAQCCHPPATTGGSRTTVSREIPVFTGMTGFRKHPLSPGMTIVELADQLQYFYSETSSPLSLLSSSAASIARLSSVVRSSSTILDELGLLYVRAVLFATVFAFTLS